MAYRDCSHTPGIICDSRSECRFCGWHPKEIERRKKILESEGLYTNALGTKKLRIKKKSRPSGANAESGKAK